MDQNFNFSNGRVVGKLVTNTCNTDELLSILTGSPTTKGQQQEQSQNQRNQSNQQKKAQKPPKTKNPEKAPAKPSQPKKTQEEPANDQKTPPKATEKQKPTKKKIKWPAIATLVACLMVMAIIVFGGIWMIGAVSGDGQERVATTFPGAEQRELLERLDAQYAFIKTYGEKTIEKATGYLDDSAKAATVLPALYNEGKGYVYYVVLDDGTLVARKNGDVDKCCVITDWKKVPQEWYGKAFTMTSDGYVLVVASGVAPGQANCSVWVTKNGTYVHDSNGTINMRSSNFNPAAEPKS